MERVKATVNDLQELCELYSDVAEHMESNGSDQWHWGDYPSESILREDIELERLYILRGDGKILASVAILREQEPEYEAVPWTFGIRPAVFHRLAVRTNMQGRGIAGGVLDDMQAILRREGFDCLRCDTYVKNKHAIRLYEKMGFRPCGQLRWDDGPRQYFAFDKALKRESPLLPIKMTPAFRSGSLTPWGGEKLRTEYGKEIPEVPTGESLEISCIPGLESRDGEGRTLPDLIREFGEKLIGSCITSGFPLLLKLLDANDRLSVQVHPDDAYAWKNENGKLGKTEAWLILSAEKGSEIVYGIVPGVSREYLQAASEGGQTVGPLLRRVSVRAGDVFYIPAGCVHAIGKGITLYEIQQSSDITYRFYDWDRTDAQGNKRELHLQQALDVTDIFFEGEPRHWDARPGVTRMLTEKFFTLDLIGVEEAGTDLPPLRNFGLLTVLDGTPELCWEGGSAALQKGESLLLPCSSPALRLKGNGKAALSMPVRKI